MTYILIGVTLTTAVVGGVEEHASAVSAGKEANAQGAFSDYQNRLGAFQKMVQSNEIMQQATQQTTAIKGRALAIRGQVAAASGASGTVGNIGGGAHAQEVVERGAAADVAATIGSAINKSTATTEAALNDNTDAENAITSSAAQANSLVAAGTDKEVGSILSGVVSATGQASKAGLFTSTPSSTTTAPPYMSDNYNYGNGDIADSPIGDA